MVHGYADVLVGLQYGDEGKARVVDMIAQEYDIIARFNGGPNAGHTVVTDQGTLALKHIPSGVFYPDMVLYIGSGCVVNPTILKKELEQVAALGLKVAGRMFLSSRCSVIQPHHILQDSLTGAGIGTTKNGIGPCYADRALRMDRDRRLNITLRDLVRDPNVFSHIEANLEAFLTHYPEADREEGYRMLEQLRTDAAIVHDFITEDPLFVEDLVRGGKNILFEGAQSVMLDVVRGSLPYVTSSYTVAAAAYTGGDLSPQFHRKTIGVAKALMSRVGYGPFFSEIGGIASRDYCMADGGRAHSREYEATLNAEALLASDNELDIGIGLRIKSREYGTVTGRPRRIGMMDAEQLRFVARTNGVEEVFLTKCDLLSCFAHTKWKALPLITGYGKGSQSLPGFPLEELHQEEITPIIKEFAPFEEDISAARTPEVLPESLKEFLRAIESHAGCRIIGIGVGPGRDQSVVF